MKPPKDISKPSKDMKPPKDISKPSKDMKPPKDISKPSKDMKPPKKILKPSKDNNIIIIIIYLSTTIQITLIRVKLILWYDRYNMLYLLNTVVADWTAGIGQCALFSPRVLGVHGALFYYILLYELKLL